MTPEWEAAAKAGNVVALSSMVHTGADPNALDSHGQTALMLAAHSGHREAVQVLIDAGADLNRSAKFGLTATMLAVVSGHAAIATLLAEAGADLRILGSGPPGFASRSAADLARARGLKDLAMVLDPSSPAV